MIPYSTPQLSPLKRENPLPSNERRQLVQRTRLNLPPVRLVPVAQEVALGRLVTPEDVLEPGDAGAAELTAVVAEQVAAVAEGEVALPRGGVGGEGFEVALGLFSEKKQKLANIQAP